MDLAKSLLVLMAPFILHGCIAPGCDYVAEGPRVQGLDLPRGRSLFNLPELGNDLVMALFTGTPAPLNIKDRTIVVTTFADVNDLERTTAFGRTLQEAVMNALTRQGILVKEVRRTKALNLMPHNGEFILSRVPDELESTVSSELLLTGTFSETPTTVIVNARIIDFRTRVAIAAASREIVKTSIISALLRNGGEIEPTAMDRVLR